MPGHRAVRELGVRRMPAGSLQDAVGQHGLARGDGVVEVVGGLGARVVVERHPVLGADRLGGHEAAVTLGLVGPEPSLGGAVPVVVHAGPPGVGHGHPERGAVADRRGRGDDQLVGRARGAVPGVPSWPGWWRSARGCRPAGAGCGAGPPTGLTSEAWWARGSGSFWPFGSPGYVGWTNVNDAGPAVHPDRGDGHVRAGRLVHRPALEVQAEAGQALGGPVGQRDVVAGQEAVAGGVVDQADTRCARWCSRRCRSPGRGGSRAGPGCGRRRCSRRRRGSPRGWEWRP